MPENTSLQSITEELRQQRLQKMAKKGLDVEEQQVAQQTEPPLSVELTFLEECRNPVPGTCVVKDYMIDHYLEEYPAKAEKFLEFLNKSVSMFFSLPEYGKFLHYWFLENAQSVFEEGLDKQRDIQSTEIGTFLYDQYLAFQATEDSMISSVITTYPKRVSMSGALWNDQPILALYDGVSLPVVVRLDRDTLSPTMTYILYNSIKIGYQIPTLKQVLSCRGVTLLGGQVLDLCASFWLLFGMKSIPSFDEVSRYYQFAHWKRGWDIVSSEPDPQKQLEMMSLLLASEVRELWLIRQVFVDFIVKQGSVEIFRELNASLDTVYASIQAINTG